MIGEITSLEKIRISAHLAVQLGKPMTVNPYPITHAAHGVREKYYFGFRRIVETDKADLYGGRGVAP